MTAFVPIAPSAARELLTGIGTDDASAVLIEFVEAGLIKAYARVIETLCVGAGRTEVHDARIPRDLWRRIVAEGKVAGVWSSSTVKLDGDGMVGGKPEVTITGIRFNEQAIRDAAAKHAAQPEPVAVKAKPAKAQRAPVPQVEPVVQITDAPPLIEIIPAEPAGPSRPRALLTAATVTLSIADTMEVLSVSRGTVNNLVKRGHLGTKKVGSRTVIIADSVREYLARP